jgi:hypothetical protein
VKKKSKGQSEEGAFSFTKPLNAILLGFMP